MNVSLGWWCRATRSCSRAERRAAEERDSLIDSLLVHMHSISEMTWWTGLAPWDVEFPFPSIAERCAAAAGVDGSESRPVQPRFAPHAAGFRRAPVQTMDLQMAI